MQMDPINWVFLIGDFTVAARRISLQWKSLDLRSATMEPRNYSTTSWIRYCSWLHIDTSSGLGYRTCCFLLPLSEIT
jgi:hypothetical protein